MRKRCGWLCAIFAVMLCLGAQKGEQADGEDVRIRVDVTKVEGPMRPVWSFFGYDEPNYTYAENGKKLLGELHALSPAPVYVRVHNLLTSGDGSASLKWGSTNAYTEDATGKPVYDWKIVDRIFDTFHEKGITPLVEVGFMPEALSMHPEPYRHSFPQGNIFTGWAYPPKDYAAWEELVYQFARHLRGRYGDEEVKNWLWEIWNEPDIEYWKGTREEFFKLYDYAAEAISRAIPGARVGGPDSTGAAGRSAAEFLRAFLEHCARGTNAATGKPGALLSFISFHPKGAPKWKGDHVQMGLERELLSVEKGFEVIAEFSEWRKTPVILGEWDPEGCAACSAKANPQNQYRNGNLYAAYTAEAFKDTLTLGESTGVNLTGALTWAFEFEGQPPFEGYRELATNGIDKPVLNTFRMLGSMRGERVELTSTGAAGAEAVLHPGAEKAEGVDGIAAKGERELAVMVWNFREEDVAGPAANVKMEVHGLPEALASAKLGEFRIDAEHSNSYSVWQKMGSPQNLSSDQYKQLEKAGQLERLGAEKSISLEHGKCEVTIELPRQALSLLRMRW